MTDGAVDARVDCVLIKAHMRRDIDVQKALNKAQIHWMTWAVFLFFSITSHRVLLFHPGIDVSTLTPIFHQRSLPYDLSLRSQSSSFSIVHTYTSVWDLYHVSLTLHRDRHSISVNNKPRLSSIFLLHWGIWINNVASDLLWTVTNLNRMTPVLCRVYLWPVSNQSQLSGCVWHK